MTQNHEIPVFDQSDIEKNKTMAGLGCFIFFLPLIVCPQSAFGRFYANQGLIFWILYILVGIVDAIIPILGFVFWILRLAIFLFELLGMINAFNGRALRAPFVGNFDLIR